MKAFICALMIVFISGCASVKGSYVIDGSSAESTKQGIAEVNRTLKPIEQQKLIIALLQIQLAEVTTAAEVVDNPELVSQLNYALIGEHIDGLSYYEVLAYSETLPNQAKIIR